VRNAGFDDFLYNSRFRGLRFFAHLASGCSEQSGMLARFFCGLKQHLQLGTGQFVLRPQQALMRALVHPILIRLNIERSIFAA
jgi:hypothetical protein